MERPSPLKLMQMDDSSTTVKAENPPGFEDENYPNISVSQAADDTHNYGPVITTILAFTMVLFMLFAFFGNVLVILTVMRHKGMRTRTNMFIVNLAVADILVAMFNMPFSLITVVQGRWMFGDEFCQLNGFLVPLFFIVSIHTLMCISIHKYISITRPFSRTMTPRKILMMIIVAWLWSGLCAITTLKGGNHVEFKKGSSQCGPSYPDELNEYVHSLMITICNYVIPLSVMSFCYFNIFREIHEHMIRIRETSNVDLENSLDQQKRISCTLFLVLACYLVCWTPFIAYSCFAAFVKDKTKVSLLANPVAYWCGYMNSACNPIIYALRSGSFREGYKEILCSYNSYNVGGSIMTRPSASTFSSMRISPKQNGERYLKSTPVSQIPKSPKAWEKTQTRWQMRKASINIPRLTIKPEILSDSPGSSSYRFESPVILQHGLDKNMSVLKKAVSLTDINDIELKIPETPARKFSSLLNLSTDKMIAIKKDSLSLTISPMYSEHFYWMDSCSTIGKVLTDFNSSDEETLNCPIVVIDEASLHSSTFSTPIKPGKRSSRESASLCDIENIKREDSPGLEVEFLSDQDSKWSPLSMRSLEMGRCRRNSSKKIQGYKKCEPHARIPEKYSRRKSRIDPDSPFYTASREQLLKWMSQDYLDCIGSTNEGTINSNCIQSRERFFSHQ